MYLGIDIGGSSIKAGLVNESGVVQETRRAVTDANRLSDLVSTLLKLVFDFRNSGAAIDAIGIGVAGLLSHPMRVMHTSPNIPCLHEVNLDTLLADKFGVPVIIDNDAKAGAYAEWACGGGRGSQHLAYITLGTGMGCGIIVSTKIFRGASGFAGELGHTTIEPDGRPCACGSRGCLETRVSATGIVATAAGRLREYPTSSLRPFRDSLTAENIYQAAMQGDALARSVFEETGRFLGIACANLINLLNPQTIVVGGGVMASGDLLLGPARAEVRKRAFGPAALNCPIVQSQLWPDAGLIGAALLARDR